MEIKQIAAKFSVSEITDISIITGGHINQSYLVANEQNEHFVLQKINTTVFQNPVDIIDNLIKINRLLDSSDYPYRIAGLRPTIKKESYYQDKAGCWRSMDYIDNTKNLKVCPNAKIAASTGKAFGLFAKYLRELPTKEIKIVIPDFRNPEHYFRKLEKAIEVNYNNRVKDAEELISNAFSNCNIIDKYKVAIKEHPIRLVHNDTKISNLLFNKDLSEVKAIIDFDTVMPGYLINDFGDMVRSVCNPAAEDEADLSKVVYNADYYKNLHKSYLFALMGTITPEEKAALNVGAKSVIYTQFIRFLSDYLVGDKYYRIEFKNQNLNRAKVQLHLLLQIINLEDGFKIFAH